MTLVVQTTISINEDDLRLTTSTPKYPMGIIYEVRNNPAESNINSKFIYLRAQASGGDLNSFQPYMVIGTGLPEEEYRAVDFVAITAPGINVCVAQGIKGGPNIDVIPQNNYAFFLLSGSGKARIESFLPATAGFYYKAQVAEPEFIKQTAPTVYGNETHMSLVKTESNPGVVPADIVLFDKLGSVDA